MVSVLRIGFTISKDYFCGKKKWIITTLLLLLNMVAGAAIFTVSNFNNSGAGSLRQAILSANAAGPGPHTIAFTTGAGTISLTSALPAITVSDVTIDGGGIITVAGPGGDNALNLFVLGNGANNTRLQGMTLTDVGNIAIWINAPLIGVTIQDITIRHTGGNFINNGIYVGYASSNMTIGNLTINNIQPGACNGIWFNSTVSSLVMDSVTIANGGGANSRGIHIQGTASAVSITNSVLDMDRPGSADDADYGIYFNSSVNGLTLYNVTMHDPEVYGLYVNSLATGVNIKSCVFDNYDGGNNLTMLRFNNGISNGVLDSLTVNLDMSSTVDDGDYGLYMDGNLQNVSVTHSTFSEADNNALYVGYSGGANHDNITISNNSFIANGSGVATQGGVFFAARDITSDAGPVVINNNIFTNNNGSAIAVSPGNTTSYIVPNFTISNNTISGTQSSNGAISVSYSDKIIITQNSIYNHPGLGIEHTNAGNCGYEGSNTPLLVSSVSTGGTNYNLTITAPAICAGGCNIEVYATDAGVAGVGGQYYITTLTGVTPGTATYPISAPVPPASGAPYGVWTATLRNTTDGCGTSEFSNQLGIQLNAPAGVTPGITAWLRGDIGYTGGSNQWNDFSSNNKNATVSSGTPAIGYINFNKAADLNNSTFFSVPVNTTPNAVSGIPNLTTFVVYNADVAGRTIHGNGNGGSADRGQSMIQICFPCSPAAGLNVTAVNKILTSVWQNGITNGTYAYNDGLQTATTTKSADVAGPVTTMLGRNSTTVPSGTMFDGRIAEYIVYNGVLGSVNKNKVETYLAIKYGVTLDQSAATNYVASDGTTLWNTASNGNYKNDIAGLARDNLSALSQKQSSSTNADDVVTMGAGNTLYTDNSSNISVIGNNPSSLMWSNDNGATTYTVPIVNPYATTRMSRVWRVSKTNWADIGIIVKVKNGSPNRTLLVSTDPNFAIGVQNYPLNDSGAVVINSSILADGIYFTFGNRLAGPACISTNLRAWFRGDIGYSGGAQWSDVSGNDNHGILSGTAGTGLMNFNKAVDFNNSTFYTIPVSMTPNAVSGMPNMTSFVVFQPDVNSRGIFGDDNGGADDRALNMGSVCPGCPSLSPQFSSVASVGTTFRNLMATAIWQQGVAGGTSVYYDGLQSASASASANTTGINNTFLGKTATTTTAGNMFDGRIAEFIMYNGAMGTVQKNQVESYLALKYGITLHQGTPTNYTASDGSLMWDATVNIFYNNSIAGLGRDSCTNLHQRQSRSTKPDGIIDIGVTMALGSFIAPDNSSNPDSVNNNLSFLVWGDNGNTVNFNEPVNGAYTNLRMLRTWRVDKSANWVDKLVTLKYEGPGTDVYLIISNTDPDFGVLNQELLLNPADNTVSFNSAILPDGSYFTFAIGLKTPGCVNIPTLWLKANKAVTTSGGAVSLWADVSNTGNDASQATATNQPQHIITGAKLMNYNEAVDFDGVNDNMVIPYDINPSINPQTTWFVAYRGNVANGSLYGNEAGSFNLATSMDAVTGTEATVAYPGGNIIGQSLINTAYYNDAAPAGSNVGVNGGATNNFTYSGGDGGDSFLSLGVNGSAVNNYFTGQIGEIITYERDVLPAERSNVESYLAVKYGVTLAHNYTSNGTVPVLWNVTGADAAYSTNIAGIWRYDCTELYQKQSRSTNDTAAEVVIALTNLKSSNTLNNTQIDNEDFLLWGASDNVPYTFNNTFNAMANGRLSRIWKVRDNGAVGLVQLSIPQATLEAAGALAGPCDAYVLLVSKTNALPGAWDDTNADRYSLSKQTINGIDYYTTYLVFAPDDDRYFTFARIGNGSGTPYLVPDGTQVIATSNCEDANWIYFSDPADLTHSVLAIKKNGNSIDKNDFAVTVDVTTANSNPLISQLGRIKPGGGPVSAVYLMRRLAQVTFSPAAGHSITTPVTVRMYYDDGTVAMNEKTIALDNLLTLINGNSAIINSGPTFQWFKAGGQDIPTMFSLFTYRGVLGSGGSQYWSEAADADHNYGTDGTVPYVDFMNVSSFSTFGGGWIVNQVDGTILPVKFINFDARKTGSGVKLTWKVGSEENIKGYYIERSTDGINWQAIGFTALHLPAGTNEYSFTDASPAKGKNYYRIREEDINGRSVYSVKQVIIMGENQFSVLLYPVPASNVLSVSVQVDQADKVFIQISDAVGRAVISRNVQLRVGSNTEQISVSNIAKGMYFLKVTDSKGRTLVNKFVKE